MCACASSQRHYFSSNNDGYPMTLLLDRALEVARNLPPEAQDDLAHIILRYSGAEDEKPVPLTAAEKEAIARSRAAAARGELATETEVQAVWAKHEL